MPDRVTKLRALYQRKKGRDLFDLQVALDKGFVDAQKVMDCYNRYMEFSVGKPPSYKQFMQNMELKMQDSEFLGDTELLLRPKTMISIKKVVVSKMETTAAEWRTNAGDIAEFGLRESFYPITITKSVFITIFYDNHSFCDDYYIYF